MTTTELVTLKTFHSLVKLNLPFTITPTAAGPQITHPVDSALIPDCVTTHKGTGDLLIDFDTPENSLWEPVAELVTLASELFGDGMARSVIDAPEPTTYVVMEVFSETDEEVDFGEPIGWTLLRLREQ